MDLWEVVGAFAGGFVDGLAHQASISGHARERGRIQGLCRELNWSVDGWDGDTILLQFNHSTLGPRHVRISSGDDDLVLFAAYSAALPPAESVTEQMLGYLLAQNARTGLGGWFADVSSDGAAVFGLLYHALGDGLDAPALKFICERMAGEVFAFDQKMQAARLL